jgi:hypothetical protein
MRCAWRVQIKFKFILRPVRSFPVALYRIKFDAGNGMIHLFIPSFTVFNGIV